MGKQESPIMNVKPKKILPSSFTGHKGILMIHRIVADMGWLFTETVAHTDGGIDGFIEIRRNDTNEVTNLILQVQSKATAKDWAAETDEGFEFRCSERDLVYWLQGNTPVILVVSRPDRDEAYWISIKDYFKDLSARKSKKVKFDKKRHLFSPEAASLLQDLAAPSDSGLYSEPPPLMEQVISNLLPLTYFPEKLYLASSTYRFGKEIADYFWENKLYPGNEWFLKEKKVMAFHDLTVFPWPNVIDRGSVEIFDSVEWATTDDVDKRKDFVRLLNQALRTFLKARGVWRFAPEESAPIYFFAPGKGKSERRESWPGAGKDAERYVVKAVKSKKDSSRTLCFRHNAVQPKFDSIGGQWYLVVEPTYHFTQDGERAYALREEYISGIKRLEKNQAVSNNVRFWEAFLTREDLFLNKGPLEFGRLLGWETDFGIPEESWKAKADAEELERLKTEDVDIQLSFL
ncbi:MAG: DUF4365 domain-containing protein [Verrucomicrobiales bacterium]